MATRVRFRLEVEARKRVLRSGILLQPTQLSYSDGGPTTRLTSVSVSAYGPFFRNGRNTTDLTNNKLPKP